MNIDKQKTIDILKVVLDIVSGTNSFLLSILASEMLMGVVDHEREIAIVCAVLGILHTGIVRFRDWLKGCDMK